MKSAGFCGSLAIALGVDPSRYREILYEPTQAIADAADFLGFDSIIAPNARWSCNNLILFTDQIALIDLEAIESSESIGRNGERS